MTELNVGGLFKRNRHKTLKDALASAYSGDFIHINNRHDTIDYMGKLTKSIYIKGLGKDETFITATPHHAGLYFVGGPNIEISDVTFLVPNQAQALSFTNFTGNLSLKRVKVVHTGKYALRDVFPGLIAVVDKDKQLAGSISLDDCYIDSCNINVHSLSVEHTHVGSLMNSLSTLDGDVVSIDGGSLLNSRVYARKQAVCQDVENQGGLKLYGPNFKWINGSLKSNSQYDVTAGTKVLHETKSLNKMMTKDLQSDIAASHKRVLYGFFFGDNTRAEISKVKIDPATLRKQPNSLYDLAFMSAKGADVTLSDFDIPASDYINSISNGSLVLSHVHDKSKWDTNGTALSNRESQSSLFADDNSNASSGTGASALSTLDGLTGLTRVKKQVKQIIATVKLDRESARRGLGSDKAKSMHMVFAGAAGTGKTTVARLVGQALYEAGVLKSNKFVEATSKDLVAKYVGQTAPKTHNVVMSALDGVLFIDEAYSLTPTGGNSFNNEAIDQLIADMENYRDRLVVIMAGYTQNMAHFFAVSNPGLKSRVAHQVVFDNYTFPELLDIMLYMMKDSHMSVDTSETLDYMGRSMLEMVRDTINSISNPDAFGNARFVRNFVDRVSQFKAMRLGTKYSDLSTVSSEELSVVKYEDVKAAVDAFKDEKATFVEQ